ncbi:LLM class flavin-dependent oxidoreductase [Microbacterium sp. SORGH_AS_0888]|uniref:LLM class flavin-dependent oxidoreductase n=1 Tax=Microbacterium sp. SORGH_AS_0888 TaxID=3041791 RepID=UPI002787554B|nr:LLM class flavin-dependent oxidoreductase [Microbacterium sp. SORGH_AS_0888]MDQ1130544.1 alkanesulfonate monooxygenase SsuD/methylene tetrahydromethanopterin reductase-like flavin-dependent oxidoreductase (luciferase family) [Microbacterium sp. SORGH_AS_0888]
MSAPLTVGFHTRVPFASGQAGEALRDGIRLFQHGEQLGFDRGWVYQRHFDNYLASPLVFLPVVAQHTERIGLGTAIIGIRYEDPVLLAEAASTADHLTGGRLQLGLSTGQGGFDAAFGQEANDGREQSQRRLATFLRGIRGEAVGEGVSFDGTPLDEPLTVRGASPALLERVWYGGGSIASAERIGSQGLRLMLSTILTGDIHDYNAEQLAAIRAYRAAHVGPRPPRVVVSRSILPATTPELARLYAAYDQERRTQGPAASRPQGAVAPGAVAARRGENPRPMTMSPAIHGEPARIVDTLLADVALAEADELIAFLPPAFGPDENARLLEDIATHVIPALVAAR